MTLAPCMEHQPIHQFGKGWRCALCSIPMTGPISYHQVGDIITDQGERRPALKLEWEEPHPDDIAVDRFAEAMKAKLKLEREKYNRGGWEDPSRCSPQYLAELLIGHLAKGNEGNLEDVANFCMMLHQRGDSPRFIADALAAYLRMGGARGRTD